MLLVSANVGSIFEDPDHMLKLWLKEFLKCVSYYEPEFVALHCQEVGGKNYEASMQHVNQFVKAMLGCEELQKYDRARVFLDEDYTAADKFTALGNLYFIHESLEDVSIWDFVECKFITVEGREVLSGNIENVQIKEKAKFPQDFFPEFKWSRKGFIRTRWNVKNCLYDLVNIHLFHDASNIVAMQRSPSVYSDNRKAAFLHTLQRFEQDQYDKVPMFIFGDFNFRLDINLLVQDLTAKTKSQQIKGKKDQVAKIVYTEEGNGKVVLTVETKGFDHHEKHSEVFSKRAKSLQRYDMEMQSYKDKVSEFEISFPPSYPFCEDVNDGLSYMKTRCPSWCDRILMSQSAKNIIVIDEKHKPRYDIIGRETCMGDHKPVYLYLNLKRSQGKETPTKSILKSTLSGTLSINGEPVQVEDINDINIHDYSSFANEEALLPEFKNSIRLKSSPAKPSMDFLTDGSPVKRRSSFVEIAKQVVSMEKVLMHWPRPRTRPRSRHHSSSSEDMNDTESEEDSNRNKIPVHSDSGSTTQSDLSPSLSPQNMTPDRQLTGGGLLTTEAVEHDDVVLSVVTSNSLHEHDGYVKKEQDGCTVDEPTENSALMKNGEGKESKVESSAESSRRLCPCSCVLL